MEEGLVTDRTTVLPTGTVTFLFTDIEGSTRLLQSLGDVYRDVLTDHASLIRKAVSASGTEVSTGGDSFFVVFTSAAEAVSAAAAAQRSLAAQSWPEDARVRVRMGLHTGEAILGGDDYMGLDVHRASRVADTAHGGQVVMSLATAALVEKSLPEDLELRDLGSHVLKDLAHPEHLYQLAIADLPGDFPPLRTVDIVPHNLPTQLTSFLGRRRELAEAKALLENARLVTLTGPGGTGKTRLSLQIAAEVAEQFPDGVYFVSLAAVTDEELVPSTILESLGVQPATGELAPPEHLMDYLAQRSVLLVLDNFEQLIGASPLVAEILRASPQSKVIVTSRAVLRIYGEHEMPVPPLEVPDPAHLPSLEALARFEAVTLFTERAVAVRPDFSLDTTNGDAVARLTARLDGLPLAIELAASRVKLLPPGALLDRLDSRLLGGGPRDLPARQQTLYNAIAWSYDLLDEPHRRLLERFSVFVGGALLDEIEAVCGPADELGTGILDGLAELVDQSLLRQMEWNGRSRFRMLVTIGEFAQQKLEDRGEAAELRRRHAQAFLALAERAEPELTGDDRARWLDRLAVDHDNLRAALHWAVDERETEIALRLVASVWRFLQMRGHLHEGRERINEVLELPGDFPELRAKAFEAAGGIAYWQGDMDGARVPYEKALAIRRELGDPTEIANALYNLSFAVGFGGDFHHAQALIEESLAIYRELGDDPGIARSYWNCGNLWITAEDYPKARHFFQLSIDEFEKIDDPFGLGWAVYMLGEASIRLGDSEAAQSQLERGLRLFVDAGDVSATVLFLNGFAALAMQQGERERALRLAGAMTRLRDETGTDLVNIQQSVFVGLEPDTLASLEGKDAALFAEGRQMTNDEAIAYALEKAADRG